MRRTSSAADPSLKGRANGRPLRHGLGYIVCASRPGTDILPSSLAALERQPSESCSFLLSTAPNQSRPLLTSAMELQEFIRSVLVQVVRGVESAQDELKNSKATINPLGTRAQIALEQNKETPEFTKVAFEVAVEVRNSGEQSGSLGIQIATFKIGVDGKKTDSESHTSRLSFSVPVHLPPGRFIDTGE